MTLISVPPNLADMIDPYEILGIKNTATQDEIKKAYRGLAKKHHPDLNPGNKKSEDLFKKINTAYEFIESPEKREKFDRGETQEQQEEQARQHNEQRQSYYDTQQAGGRYSSSFGGSPEEQSEFFENFFRQAGAGRRQKRKVSGEDILYRMDVEFKDSVLGAEREITLATGKKIRVTIPPGIESGKKLRFKNLGGPGQAGAPAGDVYIEVQVIPLDGFRRIGADLETEVSISFIEAIVGADITIPTIDGTVVMKIPSGVSTGSKLRVRGKGVVLNSETHARGDQIVHLKVVMPEKIDPALKDAVSVLGEKFSYNPRSK